MKWIAYHKVKKAGKYGKRNKAPCLRDTRITHTKDAKDGKD